MVPCLQRPAWFGVGESSQKAWSVIGLLFAAAIFATIPISPQVTPRGVELSVNQAQAILGHWRRVYRRGYRGGGDRKSSAEKRGGGSLAKNAEGGSLVAEAAGRRSKLQTDHPHIGEKRWCENRR